MTAEPLSALLARLKELHERATKPPWTPVPLSNGRYYVTGPGIDVVFDVDALPSDAFLAAEVRNALPDLLAAAEAAGVRDELDRALEAARCWQIKHNDLANLAAKLSGCDAGGEPAVRSLSWQLEHKTRVIKIAEEHVAELRAERDAAAQRAEAAEGERDAALRVQQHWNQVAALANQIDAEHRGPGPAMADDDLEEVLCRMLRSFPDLWRERDTLRGSAEVLREMVSEANANRDAGLAQLAAAESDLRTLRSALQAAGPIPMILHCPKCAIQHIDAPEPDTGWTNPIHRTHLCHGCKHTWRPANVPTEGVADLAAARPLPAGEGVEGC